MARVSRWAALAVMVSMLGACAVQRPPAQVSAPLPGQWQAPLPHGGQLEALAQWWQRQDDALLVELIDSAQQASASVAQARAQWAQARAAEVGARAALLPALDAQGQASRGSNTQVGALSSMAQGLLQAQWEIDVFGANAAGQDAAVQRTAGADAQWHEARVSVAAQVAQQYSDWRHCHKLLAVVRADADSRIQTASLATASLEAGFTAPATAALSQASAAEGRLRAEQQRMLCDIELQTLAALSAMPAQQLQQRMHSAAPWQAPEHLFAVAALPAQTLSQRPDVYAAEREVAAASADVGQAHAQRYPRLALSGSVGRGWVRAGGELAGTSNTWSLGPLSLSLPLFDAGRRQAQVQASQARYEQAVAVYRDKLRQAASEVEQALLRLDSTARRSDDAQAAAQGYRQSLNATEARWRAGMASLVELEDVRRTSLAAQQTVVNLQQERMSAWVGLYRAAGGGWQALPAVAQEVSGTDMLVP